jgi:hypothetical protein
MQERNVKCENRGLEKRRKTKEKVFRTQELLTLEKSGGLAA